MGGGRPPSPRCPFSLKQPSLPVTHGSAVCPLCKWRTCLNYEPSVKSGGGGGSNCTGLQLSSRGKNRSLMDLQQNRDVDVLLLSPASPAAVLSGPRGEGLGHAAAARQQLPFPSCGEEAMNFRSCPASAVPAAPRPWLLIHKNVRIRCWDGVFPARHPQK